MILAIDIGNTSAAFGCLKGAAGERALAEQKGLSTKECENADCVAGIFRAISEEMGAPEGIVMSSVVPPASEAVRAASSQVYGLVPFEITPEIKLPMTFEGINLKTLGHDRIVDAAYAATHYTLPIMTVDMGTATTFNVVDEDFRFRGGMISVGVMTGLKALHEKTAALPLPALVTPDDLIGRNTPDCLLSGAVNGTAAMIDGMAARVSAELGKPVTVVITGGYGDEVSPKMTYPHHYEASLLMEGLAYLYDLNHT